MVGSLVADLVAAELPVRHQTHPFKQRSTENRPGAPVHIRHCYVQQTQVSDGNLTQSPEQRNLITSLTFWVQYPASLRDLELTMQEDSLQLKARFENSRYYGWPASGIMNITASPGRPQTLLGGGTQMPVELQVDHIVRAP